jgi:hypothetical protein
MRFARIAAYTAVNLSSKNSRAALQLSVSFWSRGALAVVRAENEQPNRTKLSDVFKLCDRQCPSF